MGLNYTPIDIPGKSTDEDGYRITETGQCALVRFSRPRGAAPSMFGFTVHAFAVEPDGSPTLTADIQTIEGCHSMSCPKADLLIDGVLSQDKVAELKAASIEKALIEMLSIVSAENAFLNLGI